MNQAALLSEIDTVINTNGVQAITGSILNGVLKDMFLNTYSAEIGPGLLPTVVSPTVTATDDLQTILARIQYGASNGTNGITSISGVLGLGSDLTQDTVIGGAFNFKLGNEAGSNPITSFKLHTTAGYSFRNIASGITNSFEGNASTTDYRLSSSNHSQGWSVLANVFYIDATTVAGSNRITVNSLPQTVTGNGTNNYLIVTDAIGGKGFVYAADYSASFSDESLVTKRWVAAALGAAAGLTATLAIDNNTNGVPIKSNDSNTFLTIINGGATFQSDGNINHNAAQHIFLGNFSAMDSGGNTGFGFNASSFSIYTGVNKYYTLASAAATFRHTVKNTFNAPVNEFSNGGAYFVSGIGIDTTATGGTDVLNIGATNANVINYGNSSTTHNFLGTAIYELQVNSYVTDKLMTLNYGGTTASGIGVGFEIEENSVIKGYFKTNSARNGFRFLLPATTFIGDLNFDLLTADRAYSLPDASGTLALTTFVTGGYVPYSGATSNLALGSYNLTAANVITTGYLELPNQSVPGTPTTALRMFADTSNRLSWKGTNGYVRTFDGTANTADRIYTLQNRTGTIAMLDDFVPYALKQNGLVSGGAITVGTYGGTGTNNDIRVAAATWFISPSNYTTSGNTDFYDITLAAAGLQRYVGFYGDNTNTITMVDGAESEYAVYPSTPVGKALIGYVLVTDSSASAAPDLSGYMLIASKALASDVIAATNDTKYLTAYSISTMVARYQNITITSSATPTINVGTYRDTFVTITALAAAITSFTTNLSGTPANGAKLWIRIKDNGTARAITWGASFVSRGMTLPTTTVLGKILNVGFTYNSVTSTWDCVAVAQEV